MAAFPYPPFVLLTYSKYGGGSDTLFVLLLESVYSRLPMPQSWVILVEKEQKVGCCVGENKRYKKSEKYKGVYQRKDGTWFFRYKKIFEPGQPPKYYQRGGFSTELLAYEARQTYIQLDQHSTHFENSPCELCTFGEFFEDFLKCGCESSSSAAKYRSLYNSHLIIWKDRPIKQIGHSDIEILLLNLALNKKCFTGADGKTKFQGFSESYQASIRKLLKVFFKYVNRKYGVVSPTLAQNIDTKPRKLKLLSLFSGIGAPERALTNMGIDFELINYCEKDINASDAYNLLQNTSPKKNLKDVNLLTHKFCDEVLPDFDIMVLGSPCQNLSRSGKREGFFKPKENGEKPPLPSTNQLYFDKINEIGELTYSGLIYRALQVAIYKRPKFIVIENVANLLSKTFSSEFNSVVRTLQDIGYNIYFKELNSKDYGVPQNRPRVFMIIIRDDLNINFKFPEPVENRPRASDWFEKEVDDKYYIDPGDYGTLDRESFKPYLSKDFDTDYIHCIKTKYGSTNKEGKVDPQTQQHLIIDHKGIRCLTVEELMRFQGFRPEDAKILLENGFTRTDIGKLVGNSITVDVLEALFREFILSLTKTIQAEIVPTKIIIAKVEKQYEQPLFRYMGNKYKLLPYLDYLLPPQMDMINFYDLFAGSATVAINTKAYSTVINEKNPFLYYIYKGIVESDPDKMWEKIEDVSRKYNLPDDCSSCPNRKLSYGKNVPPEKRPCFKCKENYRICRADYNKIPYAERVEKYWYWGLALVYHSFNTSHITHNKNLEYNSSMGNKKCNMERQKARFFSFAKSLKAIENLELSNKSYSEFLNIPIAIDDFPHFFYVDPPYYASTATYNKGWGEAQEKELYEFLDKCTDRRIYWMLSNVVENNGQKNEILLDWLKKNQSKYYVYFMLRDYSHSIYKRNNSGRTLEVAVTNYKASQDDPYERTIPPLPYRTLDMEMLQSADTQNNKDI